MDLWVSKLLKDYHQMMPEYFPSIFWYFKTLGQPWILHETALWINTAHITCSQRFPRILHLMLCYAYSNVCELKELIQTLFTVIDILLGARNFFLLQQVFGIASSHSIDVQTQLKVRKKIFFNGFEERLIPTFIVYHFCSSKQKPISLMFTVE